MPEFPIKYKYPSYPNTLVPDEKVNMGDRSKGRRLKMDYTIYNTYDEPVLRDKLFMVDEKERQPYEHFVKMLEKIEKQYKPEGTRVHTLPVIHRNGEQGIIDGIPPKISALPGQPKRQTMHGAMAGSIAGRAGVLNPGMQNSLDTLNKLIKHTAEGSHSHSDQPSTHESRLWGALTAPQGTVDPPSIGRFKSPRTGSFARPKAARTPKLPKGTMSKAEQARNPFAVATAQAQKEGLSDFREGSPGRARRDEIAEGIKSGVEKANSYSQSTTKPYISSIRSTDTRTAAKPVFPQPSSQEALKLPSQIKRQTTQGVKGVKHPSSGQSGVLGPGMQNSMDGEIEKDQKARKSPLKTAIPVVSNLYMDGKGTKSRNKKIMRSSTPTLEFTSMVEKADNRVWCPKHQRMETPTWGAHDYQKLAKGLEGLNQIAINIDTFLTSEEGEKPNA